jgi:hypothetical protein
MIIALLDTTLIRSGGGEKKARWKKQQLYQRLYPSPLRPLHPAQRDTGCDHQCACGNLLSLIELLMLRILKSLYNLLLAQTSTFQVPTPASGDLNASICPRLDVNRLPQLLKQVHFRSRNIQFHGSLAMCVPEDNVNFLFPAEDESTHAAIAASDIRNLPIGL